MARKTKSDRPLMRISRAAEAAGVTIHVIEYYILLGLISPIRVRGKHGRFFDEAIVKRIRLIRKLNRSGYTLRAIRETYLKNR